ncbi:sugar ABC transporter permease [Anaerocolumna cellulosilytica]|uniref:Sugar ABC transporter permease n=1 Tax=Anaerocolumna cellulosilytica TaxID=433286 RepID=A0A6S6R234_9FIRM|nr:sugar ABC transporter permease [Anaerocolumna cellulosilytica]MBB5197187.1 multiple sugar transport system permease protein [Anaerocolumna cellulosilytica]BCJ95399.1 sugar ABC transporter permease [Anaerocolumna cellulosilytica]
MKYKNMNYTKKLNKIRKKSSGMRRKEERAAWLFLLPSITGIFLFVLLPFADVIRRAMFDSMGKNFLGLDNFKLVLKNEAFRLAMGNTIRFLATCLPLLLLVSLIMAFLLYSQKKYAEFFKTSFLLPMAIPVASVVLLWKLLFHKSGLLNILFLTLGKPKIDFMNTRSAFVILIISYIWKNAGYNMILWLTGLNGIDISLYEAAGVDGAGTFSKFRYITLPQLIPTISMLCILSFVNSFKVFREAYLISGDYPHKSIYLLQHLFNNWFTNLDMQKMCAGAVICVVFCLVLILLFRKIDREV